MCSELVCATLLLLTYHLTLTCSAFGLVYFAYSVPFNITGNLKFESKLTLTLTLSMAFTIATTILSTLLITARIIIASNSNTRKRYSKPMEIIIESSALYSIAFLIYIPIFASTVDSTKILYPYVDSIAQSMTVSFPYCFVGPC